MPSSRVSQRRLLTLAAALLACASPAAHHAARAQGSAVKAAPRPAARATAVLLYDGKLEDQVRLEEETRAAFQPFGEKVELRTMHAGRAETVPFLRKHQLTRANAPVLLVLDEPGPRARIVKKVPLDPGEGPRKNLRAMLAALKLPVPPVEVPQPGPVAAFATDAGAEEKKFLVQTGGAQRVENGARLFDVTGSATYRLPIPEGLRRADLRAEVTGAFLVEWADSLKGPWAPLLDSSAFFSGGEERIRERLKPAVDLTPTLENLPGSLYLRVRAHSRGRGSASVSRIELVALGPGQPSAETAWGAQIEEIRKRYGLALPAEAAQGSLLGGDLESNRVLKASESPYLLAGDLFVPWGKMLTIEPGVTIRAAGKYAIRVQGDLIAKGTAEQPVLFTPLKPAQPDDWRGIEFMPQRGYSSGVKSVLEHCRIVNARAVDLARFDGEISSCVLENSLLGMRLRDGGRGRIRHNRFRLCLKGLVVDGGAGEVTDNEWVECAVALTVMDVHPTLPFKFERNSLVGSRQAAVDYFKQPNRKVRALSLPNNHWAGTAPERLIGGGADASDVALEPRLPEPPAGVGPVAKL